jgi:hypothetical protein
MKTVQLPNSGRVAGRGEKGSRFPAVSLILLCCVYWLNSRMKEDEVKQLEPRTHGGQAEAGQRLLYSTHLAHVPPRVHVYIVYDL